ncbi:hypothetical protein BDW66DRAFT_155735 [Aspergillus desertorum]
MLDMINMINMINNTINNMINRINKINVINIINVTNSNASLTREPGEPEDPIYLPYVNEDGGIPNGLQLAAEMMPALERLGISVEDRISVQTYYRSLSWNVMNVVPYISLTPAMVVTPELDVSCPAEDQLRCFEVMGEPKELDILEGKGHLDWIFGDVESVLSRQLLFSKKSLGF